MIIEKKDKENNFIVVSLSITLISEWSIIILSQQIAIQWYQEKYLNDDKNTKNSFS